MYVNGAFLCSDVTAENIKKISFDQSLMEERRMCEISEFASDAAQAAVEMLSEGYGIYEVLSVISEGLVSQPIEIHESALTENNVRLRSYLGLVNEYDKIVFTQLFVDMIAKKGILISEKDFLPSDAVNETFTYVKNPLADEAYDVFSQDFVDPRVKYSDSLTEAAKAVSSGDTEYALLPLEERGGARLSAIAELLFREELKINSVTPVFGYEGLADMKYALVSKHFTVCDVNDEDDVYLEIRLKAVSSIPLSELFVAAEAFGKTLYRVNTISFTTEDGDEQYFSVVFRDVGNDFSHLLIYLTLFSGAYTPIGLYKNLE